MASSASSYYREPLELEVEITICSANILRGYYSDRLYTYAVTWVSTNSNEKCQTSIDTSDDTDPTWNEKFVIPLRAASVHRTTLHIKISDFSKQDDAGVDVTIGSVSLPLCEVGICKQAQRKKMEVINLDGYPRGKLEFQVMIRDRLHGGEDYTTQLPPPPPLRTFNPPSAPPLQPPPPSFKDLYYREPSELEVEITICSANILRGYYSDRLYTYAVTWVSTNSNEKCQTSIDTSDDTDPTWNEKFVIPLRAASVDQTTLHIKISNFANQDDVGVDVTIGSVSLPLCEVGISKQAQRKKMEVINLSGYPCGKLEFQVMVRDRLHGPWW